MRALRATLPSALLVAAITLAACESQEAPESSPPQAPGSPATEPSPGAPSSEAGPEQSQGSTEAPPESSSADGPDEELAAFLGEIEAGLERAEELKSQVENVIEEADDVAAALDGLRSRDVQPEGSAVRSMAVMEDGSIVIDFVGEGGFSGGTIELEPALGDTGVTWDCSGGSLPAEHRPGECARR